MSVKGELTALADAIRNKSGITGKLTIPGMTVAVAGIEVGSGGGVDVSGVTATPADVLAGKQFVTADGELVSGEIRTGGAIKKDKNAVTVPAGYRTAEETVTVGTAMEGATITPRASRQVAAYRNRYTLGEVFVAGDTNLSSRNVRAGVSIFNTSGSFTSDATATAADIIAGKTAGINGEMVTGTYSAPDLSVVTADAGDIRAGKVGIDRNGNALPGTLYADFYVCVGYDGVLEYIEIAKGGVADWNGELVSLRGRYYIVDPAAVGVARRWRCTRTESSGDYQETENVTLWCEAREYGWDDETGEPEVEYYWTFSRGDGFELLAEAYEHDLPSPYQVKGWHNPEGEVQEQPALMYDPELYDNPPYGPRSWRGRPIVESDAPVFFSFGAGVPAANGFWKQTKGNGVARDAEWQLVGGDSTIKNSHSPNSGYVSWVLTGKAPTGETAKLYATPGVPTSDEELKHPGEHTDWSANASAWNPVPTFVYSDAGGYSPADTVVSGLVYNHTVPKLGEFWNGNATIKAEKFFPA